MTKKAKAKEKKTKTAPSEAPVKEEPAEDETPQAPATPDAGPATAQEQKEEESLQHRFMRLQADFDNFRKRTQRERGELYQRANSDLLEELLPVIDHYELGLNTARQHQTDDAVVAGFQLVYDQLLAALQKFGLVSIDAEGQPFDPHEHEAAAYVPSEEHPEGTVMVQTRRGYKLGDQLLRPAQGVVSSGPAPAGDTTEDHEATPEDA
jgi:molecular chaperone GrpE